MQLRNGTWESTVFNSRLQPEQIALGTVQSGVDKLKLNYGYGTTANNGNVLSQTITVPTVGSNNGFTAVQTYTYDSLNRLKDATEMLTPNGGSASQSWMQTFLYDRYGNRTFDTDQNRTTTIPVGCPAAVCNPSANPSDNKLKTSDGYQFDNAGNTTEDAEDRTFIYDAENKQVEVKNASNATIGQYFYDGDGKRVKKYVPDTGETTIFVYDAAGKLVAEYSTIIAPTEDAKVAYLTTDHLGSPRINTDGTGQVISRHDYHPFGEEVSRSGYGSDTIRKQFTGYERDGETGLDFAQARMYAKELGRFTTTDPVMMNSSRLLDPQRINLYAYVRNSPLKYIDASGEDLILANPKARKTFEQVKLRGLTPAERRNLVVGRDGKVVLRNPKSVKGSKNYQDLVSLINDKNSAVSVYTVGRNESVNTSQGTVNGQDAYDWNGLTMGPDKGNFVVVVPEGGGIPVEVDKLDKNGKPIKQSSPEDAIFWHEAMGHGSGKDNAETMVAENDYRSSRNPALPKRTGSDHGVNQSNAPFVDDPVQAEPTKPSTEIWPRKPLEKPE